jgi:hypothetical protein
MELSPKLKPHAMLDKSSLPARSWFLSQSRLKYHRLPLWHDVLVALEAAAD